MNGIELTKSAPLGATAGIITLLALGLAMLILALIYGGRDDPCSQF